MLWIWTGSDWNLNVLFSRNLNVLFSRSLNLLLNWGFGLRVDTKEEAAGLGHKDLCLTVVKVDWEFSTLDDDAVTSNEDVADRLSLAEASIRDINVHLTVHVVGKSHEEGAAGVGVESIVDPLLSECMVDDALCLASVVHGLNELEDVMVSVEVAPHDFPVEGVVAASEALLTSVVEERNASCCQREGKCALEQTVVAVGVEEARVVVVVDENAQSVHVSEVLVVLAPAVCDVAHRLSVHPDVLDRVVHRVVEEGCDVVLVVADVGIHAVEALTHLEDASRLAVLFPELLGYFGYRVDSYAVKPILGDEVVDPVLEVLPHETVPLVEVRQSRETAVLHLLLVVPVVDVTVGVIVRRLVERVDLAVVVLDGSHVVPHDVNHDPDAHCVSSIHKLLELSLAAKVRVDLVPVPRPVAVIAARSVVDDWRDPNSIET